MGNILASSPELKLGRPMDVNDISAKGIKLNAEALKLLSSLLKANHNTYGVLYDDRQRPNELSLQLLAAYYLGGSTEQLSEIYDRGVAQLEPWEEDSPTELTEWDWKSFFSNKKYERSYFDFFTDKIVESRNDWQDIARQFLVEEKLIYASLGSNMNGLIQLAIALDSDDENFAISSLTSISMDYVDASKFIQRKMEVGVEKTLDFVSILGELGSDESVNSQTYASFEDLWQKCPRLTDYYLQEVQALTLNDPKQRDAYVFRYMEVAAMLLNGAQDHNALIASSRLVTLGQALMEIALNEKQKIFRAQMDQETLGRVFWLAMISSCASSRLAIKPQVDEITARKEWLEITSIAFQKGSIYIPTLRALMFAANIDKSNADFYQSVASNFVSSRD